MKKFLLIGLTFLGLFAACKKEHVHEVTVELQGDVLYRQVLNQPYTDPGAYGVDYLNKHFPAVVDLNDLNVNKAGTYTVKYTATDEWDNVGTGERTVVVYNELEFLDGNWSFYKYNLSGAILDTIYIETLRASEDTNRMFYFTSFSSYENAPVKAQIHANYITVDSLSYMVGPSQNLNYTFYGFGTQITENRLEIAYGEIYNGTTTEYTAVISRE